MSKEPKRNVYVGHRYVPKIMGEWDKQQSYEGLSIVTHQGTSYTSKKHVPVGIDILDEEYWVVTGNYNAQIEHYRQEVRDMGNYVDNEVDSLTRYVDSEVDSLTSYVDSEITTLDTKINGVDEKVNNVNTDLQNVDTKLNNTMDKLIDKEITVHIPSDYATLQEAIDELSNKFISQKVLINLNIESGHKPSCGIVLLNRDCANFRITSEDTVVTVASDFEGDFIRGENSRLPILACLIDMNDLGEDGYHVSKNSNGRVEVGCGIRNAGGRGLYVNEGSSVEARGSIFTGCNNRNVWVSRASNLSAEVSNFSANKGGENAVYISRTSNANILESDVSNAFLNGIALVRSKANVQGCDVSGAGGTGIIAQRGSDVAGEYVNATDCNRGIVIETGSRGALRGADTSRAKEMGILIAHGSYGNLQEVISNDCGTYGVRVENGSNANLRESTTRNNGTMDIAVLLGSTINAYLSKTTRGTPNVSDTNVKMFNVPSNRDGIIYAESNYNFTVEHGEWTPKLDSTGISSEHSYSTQSGTYSRVGNIVTLNFKIELTNRSDSATGQAIIKGLPFTSELRSALASGVSFSRIGNIEFDSGRSMIVGSVNNNREIALFQTGSGQAHSTLPITNFGNSAVIMGSITYIIIEGE